MSQQISLQSIVEFTNIRSLKEQGVLAIQQKLARLGYLSNYPVLVVPLNENGTYKLVDGHHRVEAAKRHGLTHVFAEIRKGLTSADAEAEAFKSNEASETSIPMTFVDHAEYIWQKQAEGIKQEDIAKRVGWSVAKTKQYSALKGISAEAWKKVTENTTAVTCNTDAAVTEKVTGVTLFTENLLRDIIQLTPAQQLELVSGLADGTLTKGKFKQQADNYLNRNDMLAYCREQLGEVDAEFIEMYETPIQRGFYDKEWKNGNKKPIETLIQTIRDAVQEKHSIQLISGDFYQEITKIGANSVDLILTDPPYNIANERTFDFKDTDGRKTRSDISYDFGEWDKIEKPAFIQMFTTWAKEFLRILKPHGSGYIFCADRYFSYLRDAFEQAGLKIKTPLFWCKTNPGTQPVQTNYKSAVEIIFFFTKGDEGHTFNWQGENEMRNWFETPICQGNERLKDEKNNTLHPTQKPEKVITHLLEISSRAGDTVFDGFAGVGTVPSVAKKMKRRCIAIEQDKKFFEAMVHRVNNVR